MSRFWRRIEALLIFSTILVLSNAIFKTFAESEIFINGMSTLSADYNSSVRVYGGGASPNGIITVALHGPVGANVFLSNTSLPFTIIEPGSNLTVGWTQTTSLGGWAANFLVPRVFPGIYSVYAIDDRTLDSAVINLTVLVPTTSIPFVIYPIRIGSVSPSSGPVGTVVAVAGRGAVGREIRVYFDEIQVAGVGGGSVDGWTAIFQVPYSSAGVHVIRVAEVGSNIATTATFTVTETIQTNVLGWSVLALLVGGATFLGLVVLLFILIVQNNEKNSRYVRC